MTEFFRSLPFWKLEPNHTALTFENRDLVTAVLAEADRGTVVGYVCTSETGKRTTGTTAALRLPNGEYQLSFISPPDLSVIGTRTHKSRGLHDLTSIELPAFTDDLVIKISRIRQDRQSLIPGTQ